MERTYCFLWKSGRATGEIRGTSSSAEAAFEQVINFLSQIFGSREFSLDGPEVLDNGEIK